jgi:16S rRNA (uracil1498-N3)-methyltransferase
MSRRRFYAPPAAFASNGRVTLTPEETRHLRDVLRLETGDEVFVFDGKGGEFRCAVAELGRNLAILKVIAEAEALRPESPLRLTLAVALLKGEKFDLVVQKSTELGVTRIVPVATKFADVRPLRGGAEQRRNERWQRIAVGAAKQSGRAVVPEVTPSIAFAGLIESTVPSCGEWRVMFTEAGGSSLAEGIQPSEGLPRGVVALVGPEGGWSSEEVAAAGEAGWRVVTLGGRTLRAETAAIAITALLQHILGDLK